MSMIDYNQTAQWLQDKLPNKPEYAVILGTGLGSIIEDLKDTISIPYQDIPGFVVSTAPSHQGNLIFCNVIGKPILFMQGRLHYYEGHSIEQVIFPIKVFAKLGIKKLIITNAAGSLRKDLSPGDIVLINDHINFMGINPLRGKNDVSLGERFPSMNDLYSPKMMELAQIISTELYITLNHGVYLAVSGPSLETKAECAFFAKIGADVVGMSTVPEAITARYCGMEIIAFSIVTNFSNLFHNQAHDQADIQFHATQAGLYLKRIILEMIKRY